MKTRTAQWNIHEFTKNYPKNLFFLDEKYTLNE